MAPPAHAAARGLLLAGLAASAGAQLGIPTVCPYPVTWKMSESTISKS